MRQAKAAAAMPAPEPVRIAASPGRARPTLKARAMRQRGLYWRQLRQAFETLAALPRADELAVAVPAAAAGEVDGWIECARRQIAAFARAWEEQKREREQP